MTIGGSLLLPRGLGIHCGYGCNSKPKRQDAWSYRLLNIVRGPNSSLSSRYNVLRCKSFLVPSGGNGIPVLETAATALTRSRNALYGSHILFQLVPAVGIIAFAVRGLGPLLRQSRILFLHRSDGSWEKSSTRYLMTSYLQPLLLWTGAILICRVLDPIVLPREASQAVKQRLLTFIRSLSTVLAFSFCLSSLVQQAQKFFVETTDSNDARNMGFQFAGKAVYTAVWAAAVSLFMELLGFSTQKWLTAGGLGTVLLTLAGREIFTNFLSSIMIHATRPFVANQWIQTKIEGYEVSGTVEHVGWWSPTIIRGEDREAIHIPNHQFTMNVVRNMSQKTHWRIKTHLAISHLDVNKINSIVADMRKVLAKNPQVEQQRLHRRVFLENINPEHQALMILVSCFVKTSHVEEYLCVKEAILLDLLRVISHHRARLATPIRTVQKIYNESDIDSIPFADTIFSGSAAAGNRPLFLIEPSYKINGEEKAKASSRTSRSNEAKDAEVEEASTSDFKADVSRRSSSILDETKTDEVGATSNNANSNPKVSAGSTSRPKTPHAESVGSVQDSGKKQLNKIVSEAAKKVNSVDKSSDGERPAASPTVSRTALEDNIVLGVALEGSKRTLRIEEEMIPSGTTAEIQEVAASQNGSGSASVGLDTKNDQVPAAPTATCGS